MGECGGCMCTVSVVPEEDEDSIFPTFEITWKPNADIWPQVVDKLGHLSAEQREDLLQLLRRYQEIFRDTPGRTNLTLHDVDVGDSKPINQSPCCMRPKRAAIIKREINYMLVYDLIQPAQGEWSYLECL
ncbi:uncharacterized protein LOC143018758 [Oratosquilla oratoria]|uniref:uncharacterized protein LOC143018758 n=1 Tax=Oratosquilla oratoria TaxID=337810 RepID=UPI003F768137